MFIMLKGDVTNKNFAEKCILFMFGSSAKKLNKITDFEKAGIIAKTITVTKDGKRTEDMKLSHIDFEEWNSQNTEFEDSDVYTYFCEHSFLCPIFCERGDTIRNDKVAPEMKAIEDERIRKEISKTTFEGFKRFSFDNDFINKEVKRTWEDSRNLVFDHKLVWEYKVSKIGERRKNKSGSFQGAPNFPKSSEYIIFFRGGQTDSSEKSRTEEVNGIKMLPQFFWIKGVFMAQKLNDISYL